MKRVVKIPGHPPMTVPEANELVEQIRHAVYALGRAPQPKLPAPTGKKLERLVQETVAQMMTALSRKGMPEDARCSHHGVSAAVQGADLWRVQISDHSKGRGDGLFLHVAGPGMLVNIDGVRVDSKISNEFLKKIMMAAAKGFGGKVSGEWYGHGWVSCVFDREAPENLRTAIARYEAFENHPGYEAFYAWFEEGMTVQRRG